mmetsp:Transcript_24299/g.39405  ORF Transcript_24299/g.39405 Transcript_24299/m.39405 type:complete len:444 (+) Transcript_24299:156-1487(+)
MNSNGGNRRRGDGGTKVGDLIQTIYDSTASLDKAVNNGKRNPGNGGKKASKTIMEMESSIKRLLRENIDNLSSLNRDQQFGGSESPTRLSGGGGQKLYGDDDVLLGNENRARIADLCDADKSKIAKLIQQMVKLGQEKESLQIELSRHDNEYKDKLRSLHGENKSLKQKYVQLQNKFAQSLTMLKTYQDKLLQVEKEEQLAKERASQQQAVVESEEVRAFKSLQEEVLRLRTIVLNQAAKRNKRVDSSIASEQSEAGSRVQQESSRSPREANTSAMLSNEIPSRVQQESTAKKNTSIPETMDNLKSLLERDDPVDVKITGPISFPPQLVEQLSRDDTEQDAESQSDLDESDDRDNRFLESFMRQERLRIGRGVQGGQEEDGPEYSIQSDPAVFGQHLPDRPKYGENDSIFLESQTDGIIDPEMFENSQFESSLFDLVDELERQ